jgi:hypothetical protein
MPGAGLTLGFGAGRLDVFLVGLTHTGAPARENLSITGCSRFSTFSSLQSAAVDHYWRYMERLDRVKE